MAFEDVLRASRVGVWSWIDRKVEWDATTCELFDQDQAPATYAAYLECIHPEDRHRVNGNVERFVRNARYEDIEHRVVTRDGSVRWLFARGATVVDADGKVLGLHGVVLDVTERRRREELLADEASTDALTRLRNRRWLVQEGEREVARCARGEAPFSLVLLDVDDFKRINDGPGGHDAGDRFLVELAVRLQEQVRPGDALIRLGGDEILAFLPQTSQAEGELVARRLAAAVADRPFEGAHVTVSAGVATWERGTELDDVLRRADREMYRAKHLKTP
jgi:diguanylate cyclase (GGDEF)-like protein/PAS domain S-box-containing protein